MKRMLFYPVIFICSLLIMLQGCFDDEFTTNPANRLSFSTDSVKFDTIFTEKGTATMRFTVYNRSKKALKISSITLADAENSGFYINVDGRPGPDLSDVIVWEKDSIMIFVKANVNPTHKDLPQQIKDSIVFITNGVRQDVKLEAYGWDAIVMKGKELPAGNTTLNGNKPYLIYDSLVVTPEATLTLQPGAKLFFYDKAMLLVKGRLAAEGTAQNPVQFRGYRLDKLFSNLPYDYLAGQWGGIRFFKDSYENKMNQVRMRGSSYGIAIDSSDIDRTKLILSNSVIHNSATDLVQSNFSNIKAWNCQFSNAGGALIHQIGGRSEFIHCTLANYYNFDIISSAILSFEHLIDEGTSNVSANATFKNCIITGSYSLLSPTEITDSDISFLNCLFNVKGSDDQNFRECVWEADPKFINTGKDYIFDYHIGEGSDAKGKGNPQFLNADLRYDLEGHLRPQGTNPDLGAYQYIEKIE